MPAEAVASLNAKLAQFDRDTSNQVLVAIFPQLPSASLEDFTIRAAQAWRAGGKKLDNGAVLFVFVKDRKVRIEVGYGLEGALPDVTAKRIIEEQIVPRFRAGDYAGGIDAAVDAIMAATRGEYRPAAAPSSGGGSAWPLLLFALVIVVVFVWNASRDPAATYGRRGRRSSMWWGGPWGGGGGGGWSSGGGGGWSSGGGGSSGGFSGGGGSFGGGGASGSW